MPGTTSLADNFTGSGEVEGRIPDTENWYVGGAWSAGSFVPQVAGGVASFSNNADFRYPFPNDFQVADADKCPETVTGFEIRLRARINAGESPSLSFQFTGVGGNNGNFTLAGSESRLSGFGPSEPIAESLALGQWYELVLKSTLSTLSVEVVGGSTTVLTFYELLTDASFKWVRFVASGDGELDYVTAGAPPTPVVTPEFWTGFINTYEVA